MAVLSDKIIQLIAYEGQLKALKKEIILQHLTLAGSLEQRTSEAILKEKIQQYELVSEKYNEFFESILPDVYKMVAEYHELKNISQLMNFSR